jgi:hypothetical protein
MTSGAGRHGPDSQEQLGDGDQAEAATGDHRFDVEEVAAATDVRRNSQDADCWYSSLGF